MRQLFIPNPNQRTEEALRDIGYEVIPFTDAGANGILTLNPVEDFDYVASALEQLAGSHLIPDTTSPEYEGILRARALTDDELRRYEFENAAAAVLNSLTIQPAAGGTSSQQYRAQLTSQARELALLQQEHAKGFDPKRELRERMYSEFQAIISHPQVTGIEVGHYSLFDSFNSMRGFGFKITTRELTCKDPDTKLTHSIGKFQITFLFSANSDAVMWQNLTRQVDIGGCHMQAPHVFPGGNACLGNMNGNFSQLLRHGEYFAAIDMAIKFIESVNITDAAGKHLPKWPINL